MKKVVLLVSLAVLAPCLVLAGGSIEGGGASSGKAAAIAASGEIAPSDAINVDSSLGSVDMEYPEPTGAVGVTLLSSHRQVSSGGQEILLLIGIQGRRLRYEDLPAVNQSLVIDTSGSMARGNKTELIRQSVRRVLEKARPQDRVSVVGYSDVALLLVPSRPTGGAAGITVFTDALARIEPGGGTQLKAGLDVGYREVLSNFRADTVNRVLLFTDGVGRTDGVLEMVEEYHERGVEISAIGYGLDFDQTFIREMAIRGGGTTRFIGGEADIEETFGEDLTRMTVTAARDVVLDLECLVNLQDIRTWAYDYDLQEKWDICTKATWRGADQTGPEPHPTAVAASPAGGVYVLDTANGRIQHFDANGQPGPVQWSDTRNKGRITGPSDLVVDGDGNLFVVDQAGNRVVKMDPEGTVLLQIGKQPLVRRLPAPEGELTSPTHAAVDNRGYLFVSDTGNHRIQCFDREGRHVVSWGTRGSGAAGLDTPSGIAVDRYRNVYVADTANNRLVAFESDGTRIDEIAGLERPTDVMVAMDGTIFVLDRGGSRILTYTPDFARSDLWTRSGLYDRVADLEASRTGTVLLADSASRRIREIDRSGNVAYRQPIRYRFSAVNCNDYETVLLSATLPAQSAPGPRPLVALRVSYDDTAGNRVTLPRRELAVSVVQQSSPVDGISDARLLRAGTELHYALAMKRIGDLYHGGRARDALELTRSTRKEVLNARERLGAPVFEDEVMLLDKYLSILGRELSLGEPQMATIREDREIAPSSPGRGLMEHLGNLFRETALDLALREGGSVAMLGFSYPENDRAPILELLPKTAEAVFASTPGVTVVERERMEALLAEQEFSVSAAGGDSGIALGRMAAAKYVVTGAVVALRDSIVVFARLVSVETGQLESVSQVILPRTPEVQGVL